MTDSGKYLYPDGKGGTVEAKAHGPLYEHHWEVFCCHAAPKPPPVINDPSLELVRKFINLPTMGPGANDHSEYRLTGTYLYRRLTPPAPAPTFQEHKAVRHHELFIGNVELSDGYIATRKSLVRVFLALDEAGKAPSLESIRNLILPLSAQYVGLVPRLPGCRQESSFMYGIEHGGFVEWHVTDTEEPASPPPDPPKKINFREFP